MEKSQQGLLSWEQARKVLCDLIRVETANPPGNEEKLAKAIYTWLLAAGAREENLHLLSHAAGRASLVLEIAGEDANTTVGFAGHMDTVPEGNLADWRSNPFEPVLKDGLVTGRGAADMKGGLTAMLSVASCYLARKLPVHLRFLFTADEESSGMGIAALRDAGWTDGLAFLFVCEPTHCAPALCEKGMLWYDVDVRGQTSHASMPHRGINAVEQGFALLASAKAAVEGMAEDDPLLGKNTFTVTGAEGGVKINVLPDTAHFTVDVRFVPDRPGAMEAVEDELAAVTAGWQQTQPGLTLAWRPRDKRSALLAERAHPCVQRLLGLCLAQPAGVLYFTDASLVIPSNPALPFAILGPGDPAQCHCPNESIPVQEILDVALIYKQYIESFA